MENNSLMELKTANNRFLLYNDKGKLLLEHSQSKPLISAGIGVQKVISKSGFYKMREKKPVMTLFQNFRITEHETGKAEIEFISNGGSIIRARITENINGIKIRFKDRGRHFNRFSIRIPALDDQFIFGCGEQYMGRNLSGRRVPIWVSEPGVGRKINLISLFAAVSMKHYPRWFNTYYPSPVWVSSSGGWFRCNSTMYTVLDFTDPAGHSAYFWGVPDSIEFGREESVAAAVGALSAAEGRQPKLPEWAYDGLWLGTQGGNEKVYAKLQILRDAGVKVGALWCQDWEGRRKTSFGSQLRWAWEWDPQLYPDLPGFIKKLKEEGVRFLGYNNTFLTPGSDMFDEAAAKGYFIKNPDGSPSMVDVPFDPAALVDFTNPEAKAWLKEIIKKNMIEIGMAGWMADFGEMIQHNTVLASGKNGLEYHNRYPVDWAKLNQEAVSESGKQDEIIFFMRAGYAGAVKRTPLNWTGDQLVDWSIGDGLPSAISASLSMGMSGVGYVHSDIGGYTGLAWKRRSEELLMRWTEFAAFTQVMRSHEGNRPEKNAQFGSSSFQLSHLAKMTDVYCMLKPVHMQLSSEYRETGLPPIRHMILHYPGISFGTPAWAYQYLYGRDLLVAPVIRPRKKTRKVYLPDDNWIHLWSGRKYSGNRFITIEAPLGCPPVFYRINSEHFSLYKKIGDKYPIKAPR
ncbi:MAG: alpha-glucosidase [Spirochaetales bacterium]|uniref:Alpha-glucosidase n=1 Tax=Candidatus Thalassospirochaeta sargassi TaxID=3119039 RepID=A0AAJ1ICI7_9SPIO|nr:alpha-glucosidase [Spirochaetales bacterium]